ncbi:MAG: hypothetical protein V3T70_08155 [Phycisphaerae bacterium]
MALTLSVSTAQGCDKHKKTAGKSDCNTTKLTSGVNKAACGAAARTSVRTASTCGDLDSIVPQMVALVGDKTFDCPYSAKQAAEKSGSKLHYRVAGQDFGSREKALTAYATVMDDFVVKFASVRGTPEVAIASASCSASKSKSSCSSASKAKSSCSASKAASVAAKGASECAGKSKTSRTASNAKSSCSAGKGAAASVAAKGSSACCSSKSKASAQVAADGRSNESCKSGAKVAAATCDKSAAKVFYVANSKFTCPQTAHKMSKLALAAMKDVRMSYRVDGKDFSCDKMAGAKCDGTGKDLMFVVGETCTPCKVTARIALAKAKIVAALKALETA